jgi:hypothetical protein
LRAESTLSERKYKQKEVPQANLAQRKKSNKHLRLAAQLQLVQDCFVSLNDEDDRLILLLESSGEFSIN